MNLLAKVCFDPNLEGLKRMAKIIPMKKAVLPDIKLTKYQLADGF